jgi:hypothetical protein
VSNQICSFCLLAAALRGFVVLPALLAGAEAVSVTAISKKCYFAKMTASGVVCVR